MIESFAQAISREGKWLARKWSQNPHRFNLGREPMNILFKRQQTSGQVGRVTFKLWSQIELDENEKAILKRYRFDEALLVDAIQPNLLRNSGIAGLVAGIAAYIVVDVVAPANIALLLALAAIGGGAYWWYHNNRETVFVRDLLHGRHFACKTVIDLAQKEAWLTSMVAFLRQVMESAKNWDGTETIPIIALPKDEARQVILKAV